MLNASFLKRREIAVHFLQTTKRSKNRSKLPKSITEKMVNGSFVRSEINTQTTCCSETGIMIYCNIAPKC